MILLLIWKKDLQALTKGLSYNNIKTKATILSGVIFVKRYVCCHCGYTEEWIDKADISELLKSKKAHRLIKLTRDMFIAIKPKAVEKSDDIINYEDLAEWYQEARYSFRRIEYYIKEKSAEDCFLMGCYLQIEFDAIRVDFNLENMDLLSVFSIENLRDFATRSKQLEEYILSVLHEHNVDIKIYHDINEFLQNIR